MELEKDGTLPFLDLLVSRKNNRFETCFYSKPTDTGLYITDYSHCDNRHKINLVKGLAYRAWSLASTFHYAVENAEAVTQRLIKNGYKRSFINPLIKSTISVLYNNSPNIRLKDKSERSFSSNLLIAPFSSGAKKLKNSIEKLCIDGVKKSLCCF